MRATNKFKLSTSPAKRLIVNAGDLGLSRGITDGILVGHLQGIITSASMLVNQAATEYALQRIREAPNLAIGVHLNICSGSPILSGSEIPSLVTKDGRFYSSEQLVKKLSLYRISAREIEAEFRAQIRWMKSRGITPTHADSEDHWQLHPAVQGPFCRAVRAEGISRTTTCRRCHYPRSSIAWGSYNGPAYRRFLLATYFQLLHSMGFRKFVFPDYTLVCHPRYRRAPDLFAEGWQLALENLPPGTYEINCHPGLAEKGLTKQDDLSQSREMEVRVLTDPRIRAAIERNNIQLITYSQLEHSEALCQQVEA